MNKEEAKKEFALWLGIYYPGFTKQDEVVGNVHSLIDDLESEHKPVELPDEVGKWIDHCKHDLISISDALNHSAPVHGAFGNEMPVKVIEWLYDGNHQLLFAKGYLNGWTPEPEKQFVLPMTVASDGEVTLYAHIDSDGDWDADWACNYKDAVHNDFTVTQSDIDSAPAWVKAIKPMEVHNDDD